MPSDPATAAAAFVRAHATPSIPFDFSLDGLHFDVDAFFESPAFADAEEVSRWKAESGLGAYVGEALARIFGGTWMGSFSADNPGPNLYLSWVEFGAFKFFPSHFVGYRIANGPSEGTFTNYLDLVLPKIRAGIEST